MSLSFPRRTVLLKTGLRQKQLSKIASYCEINIFRRVYMHGSLYLLFSKNTAVRYILECYMHGSLFFSENTAAYYVLKCYMHGTSIQFVVFKVFAETVIMSNTHLESWILVCFHRFLMITSRP